jgi:hypothetical protein
MFHERIPAIPRERATLNTVRLSLNTRMAKRCLILRRAILVSVCFFLIACGEPTVKVYPVRGEVYFNGQPESGATIHFHPVDKGEYPPAYATVDDDGSYSLTTLKSDDGAAAGDYISTVNWPEERQVDSETILGKDRLGGLYGKPDVSKLTATVSPGENEIERFDLKKK